MIQRRHADTDGHQRGKYLSKVRIIDISEYMPHEAKGEQHSFCCLGSPSEAAYLKLANLHPTDVDDYIEEIKVAITSAMKLAVTNIQKAQW